MRLEHDGVSTQLSLQSDLDKAMHKLRTYEALEEEVDSAIMRTAQSDPSADTDSMTQQLLKSVRNIPVNPERRVRQAVFLAQKLLESDRQREEAERRCQKCEGELRVAKEQLAIARENLSRAAQPTQYLVSKLRDEEAAKIAFLKKVDQLSAELIACQQTLNDSTVDNANLRERLQSVLEQREELETVRIVLEKLRMDAMAAEDDDSVEGEYGDTPHGESNNLLMHAESHRFGEEEHKQHQNTAHSPHGKTNLDAMSQKFNLSAEKLRWMTSPPSSSPRK